MSMATPRTSFRHTVGSTDWKNNTDPRGLPKPHLHQNGFLHAFNRHKGLCRKSYPFEGAEQEKGLRTSCYGLKG